MASVCCPTCGQDNSEFNLCCSSCGKALPHNSTELGPLEQTADEAGLQRPGATESFAPVQLERSEQATPRAAAVETASLAEVSRTPQAEVRQGTKPTAKLPPGAPGSGAMVLIGEILAGRYRIVRFIAHGGMGEVYEAEDLALRGRVALKTVRPQLAQHPRALARFRREIQLARQVTHPNVCRIFDLGTHRDPSGEELQFLTMELLEGQTLSAHLKLNGRLSESEALPLLRQMASALSAAHEAGVVHRDFKSQNVMLVPVRDKKRNEERGTRNEGLQSSGLAPRLRAVVTDFGLARESSDLQEPDGPAGASADPLLSSSLPPLSSLTGDSILGTPAYMAPEQVQGKPVTAAADLYALGVVLYEMLTAQLPFVADTALKTAMKRLHQPAPSPRLLVSELSRAWEAAILRCLEREPASRFATAAEVPLAVVPPPVASPLPRRRPAMAWLVTAGSAATLAMATLLTVSKLGDPAAPGPDGAQAPVQAPLSGACAQRCSVAVLGFRNLSGGAEADWLSTALSEMLDASLGAGRRLRSVAPESIARMKLEQKLGAAGSYSKETLTHIRKNLGADFVVAGSYVVSGAQDSPKIALSVRLQDTRSGELVDLVPDTAAEAELFELVARTATQIRMKFGDRSLSLQEIEQMRALSPSDPEALRLHAQGLERLQVADALAARDLLQQAIAIEPRHPLLHSALSLAWQQLGHDQEATTEARLAFELAQSLSNEERSMLEARHREASADWDKAISLYRALYTLSASPLESGLQLASAEIRANRGPDALATLEALSQLPAPASQDPRIDLAAAEASFSLADYKASLAAVERAVQKGQDLGAQLLVADARIQQARSLSKLGAWDEAIAAAEAAKALYLRVGHRRGQAQALRLIGLALGGRGDVPEAEQIQSEAIQILREIGDRRTLSSVLFASAQAPRDRGELTRARAIYEETLELARELGDKASLGRGLNSLGIILQAQGDLAGARSRFEETLALARQTGDRFFEAAAIGNIGQVSFEQGLPADGRSGYEQALALYREIDSKIVIAYYLGLIGEVLLEQGDRSAARRSYEEALAVERQAGPNQELPEIRLGYARLCLEEGRLEEAESLAREALARFRKETITDSEALALTLLGQILSARGQAAEADESLAQALAIVEKGERFAPRVAARLVAARIQSASANEAVVLEAIRKVESALAEAEQAGWLRLQLEASLILGELELHAGRAAASRSRLQALQKRAAETGFGLMADKAARRLAG